MATRVPMCQKRRVGVRFGRVGVQFGRLEVLFGSVGVQFGRLGVRFGRVGVQFGRLGVRFGRVGVSHTKRTWPNQPNNTEVCVQHKRIIITVQEFLTLSTRYLQIFNLRYHLGDGWFGK